MSARISGCGATAEYSSLPVGALRLQEFVSLEACASKTPFTLTLPDPKSSPPPRETLKRLFASFVRGARLQRALEVPW